MCQTSLSYLRAVKLCDNLTNETDKMNGIGRYRKERELTKGGITCNEA